MLLIHKLGHRLTQVSSFFSMSIVIVRDSLPYVITERKQNVWLSLFQFQIKAADKQWRWYIVYQTAPLPITRMTIKIISAVENSSILTRRSAAEWPPRYTAQSLCRIVSLNAESCRNDYEPIRIHWKPNQEFCCRATSGKSRSHTGKTRCQHIRCYLVGKSRI